MKHTLSAFLLAGITVGIAVAMLPAQAQVSTSAAASASASATPGTKPANKKIVKKKTVAKVAVPAVVDEDEKEPDVTGTTVTDYQCEMGNKLTVFQNADDNRHIALKWGKRLHQMDRIDTSTGADRFENRHYGLVWISIPAKGMLLDSKNGHQLANECKNTEQLTPKTGEIPKATAASQG